ncbi:MAG: SIS domain-containing protein [Bacteroidota bacterium]
MNISEFYDLSLRESVEVKERTIDACRDDVFSAIELIADAYRGGGKVLFCGNGGSAADSQHLATELMIRLNHDIRRPALGAISLCTDPSNITACGNDLGFEQIFARNVEGLGSKGDVLVGISTSGRSRNVVLAVEAARRKGMRVICLLGGTGGDLKDISDVAIVIPSSNAQRIQEAHITLGHIICESVEQLLHGES